MDFITKLPRMTRGLDSIWVIVDRLAKNAHFIPIIESISSEKLSEIYIREVVVGYGVPVSMVSDHDDRFTSKFLRKYYKELGTQLHFSTTNHP